MLSFLHPGAPWITRQCHCSLLKAPGLRTSVFFENEVNLPERDVRDGLAVSGDSLLAAMERAWRELKRE